QAEDGIRDRNVTGVQTCALPIWRRSRIASSSTLISDLVIVSTRLLSLLAETTTTFKTARTLALFRYSIQRRVVPWSSFIISSPEIGRASCRESGYIWVASEALRL